MSTFISIVLAIKYLLCALPLYASAETEAPLPEVEWESVNYSFSADWHESSPQEEPKNSMNTPGLDMPERTKP